MIFTKPNYKGYEFFYTNGSSHTKGGGLEEPTLRNGWPVLKKYQEKYNVSWNNRDEVCWPTRLSENLGIPVVNEAECGGGLFRAVRMAYRFIEDNLHVKDKFFIILELPDPGRLDLYYKPANSYYIVNTHEGGKLHWATPNYYPNREQDDLEQEDFRNYVDKHVDWNHIAKLYDSTLAGFYSYCKLRKIPVKLLNRIVSTGYNSLYEKTDLVSPGNKNLDIFHYCIDNAHLIWDEIEGIDDGHPGYFGHIRYAEFMKKWLDKNLEPSNKSSI